MNRIIYFFSLTLCLSFFSCNNDEEINLDPTGNTATVEDLAVNKTTPDNFAKLLASSLKNEIVRDYIKKEALLQKDGDYDVLLTEVIDRNIQNEVISNTTKSNSKATLRDFLSQNALTKSSDSSFDATHIIDEILVMYPLFQISIPNMENASWEMIKNEEAPFYVAFLPDDYDDKLCLDFPAYDQEGNIHMLNGKEAPETPVIIVSNSERLLCVPKAEKSQYEDVYSLYYETEEYVFFMKNFISIRTMSSPIRDSRDGDNGGGGSGSGGSGDSGSSSGSGTHNYDNNTSLRSHTTERADNPSKMEYLYQAHFKNDDAIREYEAWSRGRPEVVYVVGARGIGFQREIWIEEKGWAGGNVRTLNTEIFTWDPNELGKYIVYSWRESDGGSEKTVSITMPGQTINGVQLPTYSFSYKIEKDDDMIGTSFVYYDDALSHNYNPDGRGRFFFKMTIK